MTLPSIKLLAAAGSGGGVGGIADPTEISDLILWLDASDTATITSSSGAVSAWADKSTANHDYSQGTSGARPTTGATTLNSLNVLDFDGGDYLSHGSAYLYVDHIVGTGLTMFVVWKRTSGTDALAFAEGRATNNTPLIQMGLTGASNIQRWALRTDSNILSTRDSTNSMNDTNWHTAVWRFEVDAGALDMRLDGVDNDTLTYTVGTLTLTTSTIGAILRTTAGNFLTGSIAECVGYARQLDISEIEDVEAYLNTKWGL